MEYRPQPLVCFFCGRQPGREAGLYHTQMTIPMVPGIVVVAVVCFECYQPMPTTTSAEEQLTRVIIQRLLDAMVRNPWS